MKRSTVSNFVQKTWEILQDQTNNSIIRWLPHGNAFEIADEARFTAELLPVHFKHANYSSFIRQLNMYNFHKRKTFAGNIEFHHQLFRRHQRQLLIGIKRKPSQADILQGQELIRKLAPECLTNENIAPETTSVTWQKATEKIEQIQEQNEMINAQQPVISNRLAFGLLKWMDSNSQTGQKHIRPLIRNNIILKTPPLQLQENSHQKFLF